jgi:hypothetical protein
MHPGPPPAGLAAALSGPSGAAGNGQTGAGTATPSLLSFESEPSSVQVGNNTLYPELRTPKLCGLAAVRYEILDLDRHMDSSEMTPKGE